MKNENLFKSKIQAQKVKNTAYNVLFDAKQMSSYVKDIKLDEKIAPLFKSKKILQIINSALSDYRKKYIADNKTMMMLETRLSNEKTTNRTSHMKNTEYIARRIAKALGLNEDLVGIMAISHDIGHTPLGHNGERYLTDIRENLGLGPYYHASLGAYKLIFENNIYAKIIHNIKLQCPELSKEDLKEIHDTLWVIMDGILSHTGETAKLEVRYNPNKTEDDFYSDLITSFVEPNYRAIPATPEGIIVQQADKISSIITDFADAIHEGFLSNPGPEYFDIIKNFGVSKALYNACIQSKDCRLIVEQVQEFLIQDTINETKRGITSKFMSTGAQISRENFSIKKSDKITTLLNELRNLNYKDTVNNVVLQEDAVIYKYGLQELTEIFKNFTLTDEVAEFLQSKKLSPKDNSGISLTSEQQHFEDYATFLQTYNKHLKRFYKIITNESIKRCQLDEIQLAKNLYLDDNGVSFSKSRACEIPYGKKGKTIDRNNFDQKYNRIQFMINYFSEHNLHKAFDTQAQEEKFYITNSKGDSIEYDDSILVSASKKNHLYPSKREAIAYQLSTSYIASLNAEQVLRLFLNFDIIQPSQYKSLTRKYQDLGLDYILAHRDNDKFFDDLCKKLKNETQEAKASQKEETGR